MNRQFEVDFFTSASEEERSLIREILSDTSVINIAEPRHLNNNNSNHHNHHNSNNNNINNHQQNTSLEQNHQAHYVPYQIQQHHYNQPQQQLHTNQQSPKPKKIAVSQQNGTSAPAIDSPMTSPHTSQPAPPQPQPPPQIQNIIQSQNTIQNINSNINTNINTSINNNHSANTLTNNIYMQPTQPSFAIPPPHVTAFAPPPHQIYGHQHIFHQPYHYIFPYNPCMPYPVMPPNSVVPAQNQTPQNATRQPTPPQISRPPNTNANNNNSHPRHRHNISQNNNNQPQLMQSQNLRSQRQHQNHQTNNASPQTQHQQQDPQSAPQSQQQQTISNQQRQPIQELQQQVQKSDTQAPTQLVQQNTDLSQQLERSQQEQLKLDDKPQAEQSPKEQSTQQKQTSQQPSQTKEQSNDIASTSVKVDTTSSMITSNSDVISNEQDKNESQRFKTKTTASNRPTSNNINIESSNTTNQTSDNEANANGKSWASLFKRGMLGDNQAINGDTEHNISCENSDVDTNKTKSQLVNNSSSQSRSLTAAEKRSQEIAKRALDKMATKFAHKLSSINLKHSLPFIKPRGFINKGNGCYLNATLQALIGCPPFYNLMKEIGDLRGFRRENSCTPIVDSFAELFLNFPPELDAAKKNKQQQQQSSNQDQKISIESLQAEAIEPKPIYSVLGLIKSECLKGAQEDAEEFLSSVLNGLHDEMVGLSEVLQPTKEDSANHNGNPTDVDDSCDDNCDDENLWREVGAKNRSLPIRTAKVKHTPIQEIFGGSLFSIRTAGKDRCGHRSPFFDIQLDISGDNIKTIQDAIKSFTAPELIPDFYCVKTKQKLEAQRRTNLDQLPPILILHLKQFVYSQDHGLKKLIKKIDYPIDLELPDICLHERSSNDKNPRTSKSYKLLAVVYHDGKEAFKGHYLTDVYHIGSSQWIRCDDSNLKVVPPPRPEHPDSPRTPYLLFYRRLNTLRAQPSNKRE